MDKTGHISKKIFITALIICALLVMVASVEAISNLSNIDSFNSFKEALTYENQSQAFEIYKEKVIILYFMRIAPFIGFGINLALAYYKTGYTRMFLVIWSMVLLGTLVLHILSLDINNIYFYIFILGHVLLIITLFSMSSSLEKIMERED